MLSATHPRGVACRPASPEHVELEQLAVAVGRPDLLLLFGLQLQPRQRLKTRMQLWADGRPNGDAILAHELRKRRCSHQSLVVIPAQQPFVDASLVTSGSCALAAISSMCVSIEPALPPHPSWVDRLRPFNTPPRYVCPRRSVCYVAETGLYAHFPAHVQPSGHALLRRDPLLPKAPLAAGRSVRPSVSGNGKIRRRRRLIDGAKIGHFYSSVNGKCSAISMSATSSLLFEVVEFLPTLVHGWSLLSISRV